MLALTYYEQIIKMPDKSDKYDLRLRIIKAALANGVKPTARLFDTTPKTVRKWLNRYRQERLSGLNELPRIPLHCPHKTSATVERKIVQLRKQYPFKGAKRLKREHNLSCSHQAIGRILREHNLVRKMMKNLNLPKYQFTAREVRSGLMFLGFANEKSASNACLFAQILCEHLRNCYVDMTKLKLQTDNGSEFIGCFRQDRTRDGFEKIVEGFGSAHKRIPVRAWSYNSDVETVHSTIEQEFYDLENFEGIKDFHQRVSSYQAWYNIVRENSNKDYKSPWQIIRKICPDMDIELVRLPPLMLDWLGPDYITRDELDLRGYDVPCYP